MCVCVCVCVYISSYICYNSTRVNEGIIGVMDGGVYVDVLGIKPEGSGWEGNCQSGGGGAFGKIAGMK